MPFIQITFFEKTGDVASGYELRNRANLSDLSICVNEASAPTLGLQADGETRALARTTQPLDPRDIERLVETVARLKPDFVLIEGVALLQALEVLRHRFPALPLILDMHNVESLLMAETDRARLPRMLRPVADALNRKRHLAELWADRRAVELASMVWTCSEQDAALAKRHLGATTVEVIANPVPDWCAATPMHGHDTTAAPVVLFVGHLGYLPNRRAVTRLCRTIMPALARHEPSAQLVVAGRNPSVRVMRRVEEAGHELIVNPIDLGPLYAGAMATAIPLAQGGGTRIKVIEALAVGCPIVATAKAVEGLGLRDGVDYLAAETDQDFARALARLASQPALRAALAEAGRNIVTTRYAAPVRRASIAGALEHLRA